MTVIAWLLEGDPALRWQVLRDLADAPEHEVAAERARVATEGAGAQILAQQAPDGAWAGLAWNPGFNSTMHALWLLWQLGLDPASPQAQQALSRVRQQVTWRGSGPEECDDNPYFVGEIEPCINGQVTAAGAYFGQDVHALMQRLLGEQLADGGWNCEAEFGSIRSSFNTTICVLEALLAYERAFGPNPTVKASRLRGQEYLLERHLMRSLSTGEVITRDRKSGKAWTQFAFPGWWSYDVLRGLDYLRDAGCVPDARLDEALALVRAKRQPDGWWLLDSEHDGVKLVTLEAGVGQPSRWNTLRALRVLRWAGVNAT
ncbi:MAG TPA: hypothetical protein VFG99_13055 [Chloroflexia bacterium]|nr:hypothetical protein [Chloroflexia bacterium]